MSIKEKLTSILFGKRAEHAEQAEEGAHPAPAEAAGPAPEEQPSVKEDPSVVKLPADHPMMLLYNRRRREAGGLPVPRLCLDEEGVLPEEVLQREKRRLESMLRNVSSLRLKSSASRKGQPKPPKQEPGKGKGPDRAEAAEDGGEEVSLDAAPWFFLSNDKLYAWVLVFPPVGAGQELTRELLQRALSEQGISFGVNQRVIDRLIRDECRYFNLFLIAQGKPAFDGKNGNIVDYFQRSVERVLEVDEYDQVDYTALNLIQNVKEGQEICRLIRPTEGEPGRTVQNQEIPAKSGKSVPLPKGRNTEISEDGEVLVASVPGHVEFSGRGFQVKPVMEIAGDVDYSTGNIKFVGDVSIKGDVLEGFTVRAMGSIWVGGVLEAGCTVEAGGDLTVVKGILGDGTTSVRAQRCVFSKYVENATISVGENLQADAIINSTVYCNGDVIVRSGRGTIIGGRVWAARKISASAVGSKSEGRTVISLGGLPCTSFEEELVHRELAELGLELEKLESQLDSPVKSSLMSKVRLKLSTAELRLRQLEEDLEEIEKELKPNGEGGRLECGVAYAGTEIRIGEESLRLRREERQCVARMKSGEIVLM